MFCKKCGKEFKRGVYCPMCGTDNTPSQMNYKPASPPVSEMYQYQVQSNGFVKLIREKKWLIPAIAGGAFLFIAVIVMLIIFIFSGNGSGNAEKAVEDYYAAYQNRDAADLMKCIPDDLLDDIIEKKRVSKDEIEDELENMIEERMDDNPEKSVDTIYIKFLDAEDGNSSKLKNFRNNVGDRYEDVMSEFDQENIDKLVEVELKVRYEASDGEKISNFKEEANVYKYDGDWYYEKAMSDVITAAEIVRNDD